jgi:probable RNA-binding protein EIF1AD
MGKPKRAVVAAAAKETMTPPEELTDTQTVARVVKAEGNSLYTCELPSGKPIVAELDPKFRNTIFIRRGGYVVVDMESAEERKSTKVTGAIINIVRDEKEWRKQPYWCAPRALRFVPLAVSWLTKMSRPAKFVRNTFGEDEDEDSNVGKMPPSDSEEEEEEGS